MIVCMHESEMFDEDTKFTVIFEGDEIDILQTIVDDNEGQLNLEQALYEIITA